MTLHSNPTPSTNGAALGTFAGVFTPSVLTILGIILFQRLGYVVGAGGLMPALLAFAGMVFAQGRAADGSPWIATDAYMPDVLRVPLDEVRYIDAVTDGPLPMLQALGLDHVRDLKADGQDIPYGVIALGLARLDLLHEPIRWAVGGGLRFSLSDSERLNLRLDAGFGPGTWGIYFTAREAF